MTRILTKANETTIPVNYSVAVEYSDAAIIEFHRWPIACGVYLLTENGRYYIGQTNDVGARFASHRLNPVSRQFTEPRCVLLAAVPELLARVRVNTHQRLVAEARFITAALLMGLPIVNRFLGPYKRNKLLSTFPEVSFERARIAEALRVLEAR